LAQAFIHSVGKTVYSMADSMGPAATVLTSVAENCQQNAMCSVRGRENVAIAYSYVVFAMCACVVIKEFSDHDFSAVLTFGAGVQTLGFLALLLKVRTQKTVKGVSSKTLEMYVAVYMCRLSSTLVKNGYLPVDRSGDWAYQLADIVTLLIVFQLLYCCHKTHVSTYQAEHDTLPISNALLPCVVVALFTHGDLNSNQFFDVMWTISMNLDTVALLPQLFMLAKIGGEVDGMTTHFVAAIFVSRACALAFWAYGFVELAPQKGGPNVAGWTIVVMHSLQLLLSADFMMHYMKSRFFGKKVVLPPSTMGMDV